MVRGADVGGTTTAVTNLSVSGIITSATRTYLNSQTSSFITLNWLDPGF